MTDTFTTPIIPDDRITVPDDRINILDNTLCVSVKLNRLGVNRKVRASEVEVDADRKMIRVSKKILDSPSLKAIGKIDAKIRQTLFTYALPSSRLFRGGIYCIPSQTAPVLDEILTVDSLARDEACQVFYADYERQRVEAQETLRALYNPLDYPSLETVKRSFGMEVSYINMGVPQNLEGISRSIFEREKTKQAAKITEAADEIKNALRSMMQDLVAHMVERLAPDDENLDDNGQPKPKKFHASMVEKMGTFLELFESKNVANDAELAALVSKAKAIMKGVDPKALRSNDDLRSYVVREMGAVKASLDTMVVTGGGRLYQDVGDDEEDAA
jgi:hypothetical protein